MPAINPTACQQALRRVTRSMTNSLPNPLPAPIPHVPVAPLHHPIRNPNGRPATRPQPRRLHRRNAAQVAEEDARPVPQVQPDRRRIQIRQNVRRFRERRLNERNVRHREAELYNVGELLVVCEFCQARKFQGEPQSLCCGNGKVSLAPLQPPPPLLHNLLTSDREDAVSFRRNIRAYNSALAFTSIGVNLDHNVTGQRGIYNFRIHGEVCHRIGSVLPLPGERPRFAQLYIHDTDSELANRQSIMSGLNGEILHELITMMRRINPYIERFQNAADRMREQGEENTNLRLVLKEKSGTDRRRYNLPTASEIAAVIPNDSTVNTTSRDIIVYGQDARVHRISQLNCSYDPLHYVLLHPNGELGFELGIPLQNLPENAQRNTTTIKQFYNYRLMTRGDFSTIHHGGRLFQQYCVDEYAKKEQSDLNYIRHNQSRLRADTYKGLTDALNAADTDLRRVGQRVILPSSFQGGPRSMKQLYQDALAIVQTFGKPDLFVTFTCNPNWPEILQACGTQHPSDRPDIVTRVFKLKLDALMKELMEEDLFGRVVADMSVIEFQKRGLPHAHILLILHPDDRLHSTEDFDRIVCAELPDPETDPVLYQLVTKHMMHGPCGLANQQAPCMKDGMCQKRFPKAFADVTRENVDGYPEYQRRNNGRTTIVKGVQLDNRFVVPYNPYLLRRFGAHINVEVCSSIVAVKYLFKYVYKGPDRVTVHVSGQRDNDDEIVIDEINQYLDCRYISASEACWHLFGFSMHRRNPAVVRLQIHLPGQTLVTFDENDENINELQEEESMLIGWFRLNQIDVEARELYYHEVPEFYTWTGRKGDKKWARKRINRRAIGRVYFVHPGAGERYYIRLLLTHVVGATSWQDLRTVNGVEYPTYQDACNERGLLQDDGEWDRCLTEAAVTAMPSQLRLLFATILLWCEPTDVATLWASHKAALREDIEYRMDAEFPGRDNVFDAEVEVLGSINTTLQRQGKSLCDYPGLPNAAELRRPLNRLIVEHTSYDMQQLQDVVDTNERLLNADQRVTYEDLLWALEGTPVTPKLFFVDGPGGSGKTFLYNTFLAKVRGMGKIALAVASSGIAAMLLPGGQTAHSMFKIPIDITQHSTCNIPANSNLAELIRRVSVVVWDEAPMAHRHVFEAVDRTLRDIMGAGNEALNDVPFGGKLIVLGGDFRQVPPVVPRGDRPATVAASVRKSPTLWPHVQVYQLRTNERVRNGGDDAAAFAETLMSIGNGSGDNRTSVTFKDEAICATVDDLIDWIFPANILEQPLQMPKRAILAPLNVTTESINLKVLGRLPGNSTTFLSSDWMAENDPDNLYPTEFLNKLEPSGTPPHRLELKVGCPIILLRNLDIKSGLCNGTRLIVRGFTSRVINAEICVGANAGARVFIPRIKIIPSDSNMPIKFCRLQFPVRLCFAMTINKAQGQTLERVGLHLERPVFSHGQLYVAQSRAQSEDGVRVFLGGEPGTSSTPNIVYSELFRQ